MLGWKPGDRVFGLVGGGAYAEQLVVHRRLRGARCPTRSTSPARPPCPRRSSPRTTRSAARPALSVGETLLVHGAAGGVGSAAVQIGVVAGARVLGTVRSDASAALVRELGGEPIEDAGFADAVLAATGGRGADVVLELVGAPHFPTTCARSRCSGGS